MTAMRVTVTQPDVRPRGWTGLALLVVALLAAALAIGLTVHHDEVDYTPTAAAMQSADVATDLQVGIADTASVGSTSTTNLLVICTLLILCCVILLAASLRARGPSRGGPIHVAAALRNALSTIGQRLTQPVSLDALSISRT